MARSQIQVDHVARIEGHGNAHLVIEDGQIKACEMQIVEPARLFESMVLGRDYSEISYISSRVCGICSASHVVTDLLAIEQIFGVEVSERTKAIRELLVYGSYLQNHATHLFVLAAPDFLNYESVFPLAESNAELFDAALGLKSLGNELCTAVGGRSIHPITAVVGGFTHEIASAQYLEFAERMEAAIPFAESAVDLFASFEVPAIKTDGDMLAMVAPGRYPICDSPTATFVDCGVEFDAQAFDEALEEYEVSHSGAFFARVRETGKPYMTGALARINASWSNLSKQAKVAAAKVGLRPPERNPFMNNVSQAVELVDVLVRCSELCRVLADESALGSSEPVAFEVKAGKGVGYTEAPRGAVFHELELDEQGRAVHATIITPTSQNLANIEQDMRAVAEFGLAKGLEEDEIRKLVEELIRAYDPCLSCSVH